MTSISATTSSSYSSPLQQLQKELQSEVSAGKISSSDQDALATALTDIDSSLQSSRASDSSSGGKASPGDLKSKIDGLIAGEVSSGKLTSDQATELQGVFKAAFGSGGPGGPGGAGGPPPGPPPGGDSSSSSSDSSSSSSSTSAADLLKELIKALKSASSTSSASSYSATGSTSTSADSSSSLSAVLLDYKS